MTLITKNMKNKERFLIFAIIEVYLIVLNIMMYIPFVVYNLSFNIANWEKESRIFYAFLSGGVNIFITFIIPAIYNDFKNKKL